MTLGPTDPTTVEGVRASSQEPVSDHYLIRHSPTGAQVVTIADGATVIAGRAGNSRLIIDEADVSREHARFTRRGSAVWVEDLESRNGTWLDGRRIASPTLFEPRSTLRVGSTRIGLAVCGEHRAASGPRLLADTAVVIADQGTRQVFDEAKRIAATPCTVLITGETGVGKEVVAEFVHRESGRHGGPFIRLNCAALPETLLEGELFGYEKGAFTGADKRREGWFEAAHGGTLFLDEIGDMAPTMQAKLLRVVESGKIVRLGATAEVTVDVRVLSATHRDLRAAVQDGTFRADLYYRLASITLAVPPLRERPTEIALLATRFATSFAAQLGISAPQITESAFEQLTTYGWPGNVRELRNVIERAVALGGGSTITEIQLPESLRPPKPANPNPNPIQHHVEEAERAAIAAAMAAENGNQTQAARRLGISRRTLVYKLTKYKLRL
jgi:two-component system, NtrC family, response regulator AtoC